MKKILFSAIVGIAFLVGTLFGTMNMASAHIDDPWKSLVNRVTALEGLINGNKIIYVHINDDDAGHALGWNPDGGTDFFLITDPNVTPKSVITSTVDDVGVDALCAANVSPFAQQHGQFELTCANIGSQPPNDGASLNYVVINPP